MKTSRIALALAVSSLVAAPSAFAQRGAGSSGSSGGGGSAVSRGSSGGTSTASEGSGGNSGGSRSSGGGGAVARSGGAWSHATAARAAARGTTSGGASNPAMTGAVVRQAGAYTQGRNAAAIPRYSRPDGRPAIGQAVPRGSVAPANGLNNALVYGGYPYGLSGYGYGYPGYGYGYGYLYGASMFGPYGYFGDDWFGGGFLGGYGGYGDYGFGPGYYGDITMGGAAYDPYAPATSGTFVPTDSPSSSSSQSDSSGALRFSVKPMKAEVYVDGKAVGQAKQYDSFFRKLRLPAGAHEVQLKADGYEPVTFHVRIEAGKTEVYKGELDKSSR